MFPGVVAWLTNGGFADDAYMMPGAGDCSEASHIPPACGSWGWYDAPFGTSTSEGSVGVGVVADVVVGGVPSVVFDVVAGVVAEDVVAGVEPPEFCVAVAGVVPAEVVAGGVAVAAGAVVGDGVVATACRMSFTSELPLPSRRVAAPSAEINPPMIAGKLAGAGAVGVGVGSVAVGVADVVGVSSVGVVCAVPLEPECAGGLLPAGGVPVGAAPPGEVAVGGVVGAVPPGGVPEVGGVVGELGGVEEEGVEGVEPGFGTWSEFGVVGKFSPLPAPLPPEPAAAPPPPPSLVFGMVNAIGNFESLCLQGGVSVSQNMQLMLMVVE